MYESDSSHLKKNMSPNAQAELEYIDDRWTRIRDKQVKHPITPTLADISSQPEDIATCMKVILRFRNEHVSECPS